MNIEITSITVVRSRCRSDKLFLRSTLPEGTYPFKGPATLTLEVAKGHGVGYCKTNFPGVTVWEIGESGIG